MSQLNLILILYILGSDWTKAECMMFETSHVSKESLLPKRRGYLNDDINLQGMGLLSYPILSTLSYLI